MVRRDQADSTFSMGGTILWVGPRQHPEFQRVYETCESRASQLAWRSDLSHCIQRPAGGVTAIVLVRQARAGWPAAQHEIVRQTYAGAQIIQLLGSLCAGERPRPCLEFCDDAFYWYQANQFLDDLLPDALVQEQAKSIAAPGAVQQINAVAIVASNYHVAEPMMELASHAGTAAIWCRQPQATFARNFDAVWWDDSIAPAASEQKWRQRIDSMLKGQLNPAPVRQAWIATAPCEQSIQAAHDAGVCTVVSKPFRNESLLHTINANHSVRSAVGKRIAA